MALYRDLEVGSDGLHLRIGFVLANESRQAWDPAKFSVGWQFFDPDTNRFIMEGKWVPIPRAAGPGELIPMALEMDFPAAAGGYLIYVSPISEEQGWAYRRGARFLVVHVDVMKGGALVVRGSEFTTLRAIRLRALRRSIPGLFRGPFRTIGENHELIRSMARRDILARYRGSFGDVFWTVLNPLLLMSTYFFVFGVVLETRFRTDPSPTGFALYFLAGMLPWLAFSEPVGRSPFVILEHRNFVKKLIFPLDTLPVNQVLSGFVTELFAMGVFLGALLVIRGSVPLTVLWLPLILIPQLLFTMGLCWFLATVGAFFRDLGQVMGFLLTLWFFITPICYDEIRFQGKSLGLLGKNPMYAIVRAYRAVFLEGQAPEWGPLWKLWVLGILMFLAGHAFFTKFKKAFADFI